MFFIILITSISILGPDLTWASVPLCPEAFSPRTAAFMFEQGLAGVERGYVPELIRKTFGDAIANSENGEQAWLANLETDVLDTLIVAPEFREPNYQRIAKRYGIDVERAEYIVLYYARLFHDDIRIAGDPAVVFPKLRALRRAHILGDAPADLSSRHLFYLLNVTKLSVPEMAEILRIDEQKVYRDLMNLGISIEEEFEKAIQRGESTGEQALFFYQHFIHEKNRGVRWDREFNYNGRTWQEEDLLEHLYAEVGIRRAQLLADKINELAGVESADDPNLRTAASVTTKLRTLGLSSGNSHSVLDVEITGFGYVKQGGQLHPKNALAFIDAHNFLTNEELADAMGVNPATVRKFLKRNFHIKLNGGYDIRSRMISPTGSSEALIAGYAEQRGAVAAGKALSAWMTAHPDLLPKKATDKGKVKKAENQTPEDAIDLSLYVGMSRYAATDEEAELDKRKKEYMAQLTPEQKIIVLKWHFRRKDPFAAAGKELNAWMTEHQDRLPQPPIGKNNTPQEKIELSLYAAMGRYAATDEEAKLDERKKKNI